MKTDKREGRRKSIFFHIGTGLWAVLIIVVVSYFTRCSYGEILRRAVVVLVGVALYLFTYEQEARLGRFFFHDSVHPLLGQSIYLFLLPLCALLALLPISAWPYPFIFTYLSLMSGPLCGAVGGSVLLFISLTLSGADSGVFLIYFVASMLSLVIFSDTKRSFSSLFGLMVHSVVYIFLLSCLLFFYVVGEFSISQILIPLSNVLINAFLMYFLIRFMNVRHFEKKKKEYAAINDQTAELMELCRGDAPALYLRAIHVSHFTVALAKCLHADVHLCRGGGYYAKLADFPNMPHTPEELNQVMVDHAFPRELRELILMGERKPFLRVESMIVALCGRIVDDLLRLKEEGADITKLYPALVEQRLKELYLSDALEKLDLSFAGFAGMEQALLSEKKYLSLL